ncbi:hypothetical protein PIB30_014597 [Stylosanthes scabra]|uniref:Uncharacterized protein n=1 Tax=Stylosanthes scabra TaxID=79078 RepID=A0ABU6Q6M7_9FABA|nr:hypothetical protein [Stylosanthes scabra]
MGERMRYEVILDHDNEENMMADNGIPNIQDPNPKEDSMQAQKTFLSRSDMRKIKAQNGPHLTNPFLKSPPQTAQKSTSATQLAHNVITHDNPNPPRVANGPHISNNPVLSGGSVVMETPPENMEIVVNSEPPDPGEQLFTGSDMDDILAQGSQAIIAYGNIPLNVGGDVEMAQ